MKSIKITRLFKQKKMLAATARRASAASAGVEFDGIPEPSMKLSRALLVVLLLHVVAVAGIIAFNAIKTRQGSLPSAPTTTTVGVPLAETKPQTTTPNPATQPKPAKAQPKVADSGKIYVVARGDNPVTIAKKFKVSYDDLVALNHIDDPRKLKIGQKLQIPEKPKAAKKNE